MPGMCTYIRVRACLSAPDVLKAELDVSFALEVEIEK